MGKKSDQLAINKFIGHADNTHNTAITSSVGIALLALGKCYPEVIQDIEGQYSFCKAQMNAYISQLPEVNAKGWSKKAAEDVIDKIYVKVETYSSEARDTDDVVLYIADQKAYVKYSFPLKMVLALVVRAITDSSAYVHHYIENGGKSPIQQAEDDLPSRAETLLTTVSNILNGTCHHGIRNDLVMCLNQTHKDVHLIEDFVLEALRFTRERLLKELSENRNITSKALLSWIAEDDLQPIFDTKQTLKSDLAEEMVVFFISYGIGREMINLHGESIDKFIEGVTFACARSEYPHLYAINEIFLCSDQKQAYYPAVKSVQAYIESNDFLYNPRVRGVIVHFYNLYELQKRVEASRAILTVIPQGNAFLEQYRQFCQIRVSVEAESENVFDTVARSPESVMVLNDSLAIEAQKKQIDEIDRGKLEEYFSNFFAKWNVLAADEIRETGDLYVQLLEIYYSPHKRKLLLTDSELDELFQLDNTGQGFVDLTPYKLGRIFLHAFLEKKWSQKFLEKMLDLELHDPRGVLNTSLEKDQNKQFIESSFKGIKGDLLGLLGKWCQMALGPQDQVYYDRFQDPKPRVGLCNSWLVVPETVESLFDWHVIFYQLIQGSGYLLAQLVFDKYSKAILSRIQTKDDYLKTLEYVGAGKINFGLHAADWVRKAFSIDCLLMLLESSLDPQNLIAHLIRSRLEIIQQSDELIQLADFTTSEQFAVLVKWKIDLFDNVSILSQLEKLPKEKRITLIEHASVVLKQLSNNEVDLLYKLLGPFDSLPHLISIVSLLPESIRKSFALKAFKLVMHLSQVRDYLLFFNISDRMEIFEGLNSSLKRKVYTDIDVMVGLLDLFSPKDKMILAVRGKDSASNYRKMIKVISKLEIEQRLDYFKCLHEEVKVSVLSRMTKLLGLLNVLADGDKLEVAKIVQDNKLINEFKEIIEITTCLAEKDRFKFLNNLIPDLTKIIFDEDGSPHDLFTILHLLPYKDSIEFLTNNLFIRDNAYSKHSLFLYVVNNNASANNLFKAFQEKWFFTLAKGLILNYPFSLDWVDEDFFRQFPNEWLFDICKVLLESPRVRAGYDINVTMLNIVLDEVMRSDEERQRFITYLITSAQSLNELRYYSIYFIQQGLFTEKCNALHLVTHVEIFNDILIEIPKACRGRFSLAYPSFFNSLSQLLHVARSAEDKYVLINPIHVKSDYDLLRLLHACFSDKYEIKKLFKWVSTSETSSPSIYSHSVTFLPSLTTFNLTAKLKFYSKVGVYNENKPSANTIAMFFANIMSTLESLVRKCDIGTFRRLDDQFSQLSVIDDDIVYRLEKLISCALNANKADNKKAVILQGLLDELALYRANDVEDVPVASSSSPSN